MIELKPCDCDKKCKPYIRYKVVEDIEKIIYVPICGRCGGKIETWNKPKGE